MHETGRAGRRWPTGSTPTLPTPGPDGGPARRCHGSLAIPPVRDHGSLLSPDHPVTATRAIAVAYSSQCERGSLISPTPALVAASRMAPDRLTEGAPRGSLTISMDRQGNGPSHAVGSALTTASLAANRAAK